MLQRIDKVRERIRHYNLDAFLITSLTHLRYLFGFTGSNAIGLVTSGPCFFITDRRYTQQADEQVRNAEILIAKQDLISEFKNVKFFSTGVNLGIEAMHLTVKRYSHLRKTFPEIKLIASERIVEKISSVKDSEELDDIKKAVMICGTVLGEVLAFIKPGISELDISAELSYRSKRHGSEKDPFEPIVISGRRSALPHGASSKNIIKIGDLVIVDFGAVINGYAADFSRTVLIGQPTPKQKEMAEVVLEALQVSEAAVKPGLSGKQLDQIARDYIKQRGYGNYFQHSLGHGLGLELHSLPRIGELSDDPIEVGNVITLEPGVYLPEIGGVRIEDDFVVTKDGVENLTQFPRALINVD